MCILFLAIDQHPKYPVIICANRDEFHQRPTKKMHWWQETDVQHSILAGKDLQAGGTWLGLNKQGRFSALTNYRQPQLFDNNKQSRGNLVLQSLNQHDDEIIELLAQTSSQYNGFNLIFGQLTNLSCFDSVTQRQQQLSSGFHSLCNGALDDIWPKMALGQRQLNNAISSQSTQPLEIEELFELMSNATQAQAELLPQTGIPLNWEQLLSSIFIISPDYGTRTTNIITLDIRGNIEIYDRSYNNKGACTEQQNFSFTIESNS